MESSHQLKHFTCNIHPSETIQRVCLDNAIDPSLKCIECVLSEADKVSKDSIITLSEFIDHATEKYKTFRRISIESPPPEEFTRLLTQEDEKISQLSQHISQEKERVNSAFNIMIEEFTNICNSKREEILRQLDKQVSTLKFNYSYFKGKVGQYYQKDTKNEQDPNKETLLNRINQCENTNQVEFIVKNIKDNLFEASSNHQNPELQISEVFKSLSKELQEQADFIPKSQFSEENYQASLSQFREMADSLTEGFVEVDNQISVLSFTKFINLDSTLITRQQDANLLKQWLAPSHQNFKLELLYRGSRDGLTCKAFHEKCDYQAPTLTIIKSNFGKIFGGYSDQTWSSVTNWKASEKAWLFSIDEKLKFPILGQKISSAVYTHSNYGPIFGSGHDICITLPRSVGKASSETEQSYASLGSAYIIDTSTRKQKSKAEKMAKDLPGGHQALEKTILAGGYLFTVEEIEVFLVEVETKE